MFEVFEELPPTGDGFLVAALNPKECLKPIVRQPDDSNYWNIINAVSHTHFEVDAVNEEKLEGFFRQITGPLLFNGIAQFFIGLEYFGMVEFACKQAPGD